MKKLLMLVTHGLGDWYTPLTIVKNAAIQNNCDQIQIYVDTIYDKYPRYYQQLKTGIKMLNSVSNNYKFVPANYFGSDNWYGCPNISIGPQYKDIKNDFCFYRKDILKKYMMNIIQQQNKKQQTLFFIGQGIWSYQWINGENKPLDLQSGKKLQFDIKQQHKIRMNKFINDNSILIHVRNKYDTVQNAPFYFKKLIQICLNNNFTPILIGLKNDVVFDTTGRLDLRQNIQVEECIYLIQKCNYAILNSSMYTFHRFFSNKPTIITTPEFIGPNRYNGFLRKDLYNQNYIFYNIQQPHLQQLEINIKQWRQQNVSNR